MQHRSSLKADRTPSLEDLSQIMSVSSSIQKEGDKRGFLSRILYWCKDTGGHTHYDHFHPVPGTPRLRVQNLIAAFSCLQTSSDVSEENPNARQIRTHEDLIILIQWVGTATL